MDAPWAKVTLERAASGVAFRAAATDDVAAYTGTISFPANEAEEAAAYEVRFSLNDEEAPAERVSVEIAAAEPGEEPGTEEPGTEEPGTEEPGTEEPGTGNNGSGDGDNGSNNGSNNGGTDNGGTDNGGKNGGSDTAKGAKPGKGTGSKRSSLPKTGDAIALLGVVTMAGAALAAGGTWIRRRK